MPHYKNFPDKMSVIRISTSDRCRIVRSMVDNQSVGRSMAGGQPLFLGDGGVSCYELGDVIGVCAEAPLPRITLTQQRFVPDGACGMASMLRRWGTMPIICSPVGAGQSSVFVRKAVSEAGLRHIRLCTGFSQSARYIRRVFADSHQLAHHEFEERLGAASKRETEKTLQSLMRIIKKTSFVCVVDEGMAGLSKGFLGKLVDYAKKAKVPVLYEPRFANPVFAQRFEFIKANHNQTAQWFGTVDESERDALGAVKKTMELWRANAFFYTRGQRGVMAARRRGARTEVHIIDPRPKKLFDLVAAGDVVTASLAFCLCKGFSILEAACFAAGAAELSLDRRYDKQLDVQSIFTYCTQQE